MTYRRKLSAGCAIDVGGSTSVVLTSQEVLTTTPPMSKRMAFGGFVDELMVIMYMWRNQSCYQRIMVVCIAPWWARFGRVAAGQGTSAKGYALSITLES